MLSGVSQTRQLTFSLIRGAHKRFRLREMPDRVSIYFHALAREDWDAFRACITYFRTANYRFVSLTDYLDPSTEGRLLFLSFDDNYRDWHDALPMLSELGAKATFYVNTLPFMDVCPEAERLAYFKRIAHVQSPLSMTREQVRDVARAGHEIGCHSHSHFDLTRLDRGQWDREIRASRDELADLIGRPIAHLAYPYGMRRYFTQSLRDYCRAIGFQSIATGVPGYQHSQRIDPFNVHRTRWNLNRSLEHNIEDIRIDGRMFEQLTGWSAIG